MWCFLCTYEVGSIKKKEFISITLFHIPNPDLKWGLCYYLKCKKFHGICFHHGMFASLGSKLFKNCSFIVLLNCKINKISHVLYPARAFEIATMQKKKKILTKWNKYFSGSFGETYPDFFIFLFQVSVASSEISLNVLNKPKWDSLMRNIKTIWTFHQKLSHNK